MKEEGLEKTTNELIYIGHQIEIEQGTFIDKLNELIRVAETNDDKMVVRQLREMVPTFVKPEIYNQSILEEMELDLLDKDEKELQKI